MRERESFDVLEVLPALRRYARLLAGSAADADDLVQDALLRAYERRATLESGRPLKPWLLSIVHNLFIDGTRRESAARRARGALADIALVDLGAVQASGLETETRLHLQAVLAAFGRLPDDQREALHLVVIENLSYQDAAFALNIPVGTLMSRLSRARGALRDIDTADPVATSRPTLQLIRGSHEQ